MYIRFVTPQRVPAARGVFNGFFDAAHDNWLDKTNPLWLRRALRDEMDWFNINLRIPNRFGVVTRKSNRRYAGVCWFRDNARACITHAYALSALLKEADMPVTRLVTDAPGDIVYRDDRQIVAIPKRDGAVRRQ